MAFWDPDFWVADFWVADFWEGDIATPATLTGTIVPNVIEDDIITGGKTVIITLASDTFIAAGAGPIGTVANTQALIDGITSGQGEAAGWNIEVRDKEVVGAVSRDSNTQATVTFTAAAAYEITGTETITVTIPAEVLVTGPDPIVASPTFEVRPDTIPGSTEGLIPQNIPQNIPQDISDEI